jgi:hypothetical protein
VIFGESGVDIEELWEILKEDISGKEYPEETAFFLAGIKRHVEDNKAVAVFVQKSEVKDARARLLELCGGAIADSCIKWKPEEATAAGAYSARDYKGRGPKVPCRFFQSGRCRNGDKCPFLHETEEE